MSGEHPSTLELMQMTTEVVKGLLASHSVGADELPGILRSIYAVMREMASVPSGEGVQLKPAVPIRSSVTPDYIICLEDGRRFKTLRRHLMTAYGLTPEAYRAKWGLPADYPMVAPNYSLARQSLARRMGLGRLHTRWGDRPAAAGGHVAASDGAELEVGVESGIGAGAEAGSS